MGPDMLAQILGPAAGGPAGGPPGGNGGGGDRPITDALATSIQALHQAIADEQDPGDKAMLATCLQNMLKVQQRNHEQAAGPAGGAKGALQQKLAGYGR